MEEKLQRSPPKTGQTGRPGEDPHTAPSVFLSPLTVNVGAAAAAAAAAASLTNNKHPHREGQREDRLHSSSTPKIVKSQLNDLVSWRYLCIFFIFLKIFYLNITFDSGDIYYASAYY